MSTVKVNEVRHLSNSGTANVVLESNATTNLQATSTLGLTVTGTLTVSGVSTFNGNTVVGNASSDTMNLISTVSGFNNFSGFTGEIRMYAGNEGPDAPPAGWLYCNGDTISSTSGNGGTHYNADGKGNDYQPLFNLLKTNNNWGNAGSPSWGTNTVLLPDFRSRSPVGVHTGAANALPTGLTARAISVGTSIADGSTLVGKETHALVEAELFRHTHVTTTADSPANSNITITNPTHVHTLSDHTHSGPTDSTTPSPTGYQSASHQHNTKALGGHGDTVGIHAEYLAVSDSQTGVSAPSTSEDQNASHTHTSAAHVHAFTTGVPNAPNTNTSATAPGQALGGQVHTHVMTTAYTGSSTAHTILSPIIAVNYIIKV